MSFVVIIDFVVFDKSKQGSLWKIEKGVGTLLMFKGNSGVMIPVY